MSNFLATLPAHDMVLIVAGFPCKDLSRLKTGCKNLDGKHSKLFYQLPRIREIAVKVSIASVRFLVENVVCDEEAMVEITKELGTRPFRFSASTVSATNRDRLYWTDSVWSLKSGEEESKHKHFTTIKLKPNPKRLDFLKEGSKFSDSFKGRLPCITGFRRAGAPPRHTAGLESASEAAKKRWEEDGFGTQVYHYEDQKGVGRQTPTSFQGQGHASDDGHGLAAALCLHRCWRPRALFRSLRMGEPAQPC